MKVFNKPIDSGFSENQRRSFLTLLNDEDANVYLAVRRKIISYGDEALDWIRPHTLNHDPLVRRRAVAIVHSLEKSKANTEFLQFCLIAEENLNLEQGVLLLARTQFPDINIEAYQALLDNYASDLQERLPPSPNGEFIIATMNEFLFEERRFCANESDYYDPENSYLNKVLDRKKGNPISLCLIYLLVAKRLSLPMSGIGLPGHFVCRFQDASEAFYVDVFNKGKILTKTDCIHYLLQTPSGYRSEFLIPVTARRFLMRICANLHLIYIRMHASEEAQRIHSYILALAK